MADAEGLTSARADFVWRVDEVDTAPWADSPSSTRPHAVVAGIVTHSESERLAQELLTRDDPDTAVRDLPWAAVVKRPDGSIAAAASTMLMSGLFYAIDSRMRLVVASDPVSCADRVGGYRGLDSDYLQSFALSESDPHRTAIDGIHRLPPGMTLRWSPDGRSPIRVDWVRQVAPDGPTLDDPDQITAEYLRRFDAVTAELSRRTDRLPATVSGGLDSTFMAASLAITAPAGRVIEGYCHDPLPAARVRPRGRFDPDDLQRARLLEKQYPGRVTITALRNDMLLHPLDAARANFTRSGCPVLAPGNAEWLSHFGEIAAATGATLRFHAGHGNAAFSYDHPYAANYYARRGQLRALVSLAGARDPNTDVWSAWKGRVIKPALRSRHPRLAAPPFVISQTGAGPATSSRSQYLSWLFQRRSSFPAAMNPAGSAPVVVVDPFSARSILELAAAVEPRQWQLGFHSRALARRLGRGRVPDEIRLRRRRGGQGMDAWFATKHNEARMDEGLQCLGDSRLLRPWVDVDAVMHWWRAARGRGPTDPPLHAEFGQVLRLVSLAEYAEWWSGRHSGKQRA